MPFVPAANVVRVAIEYTIGALTAANILHMNHAAAPLDQSEVDNMAQDVFAAWGVEVMPLLVDDVAMTSVTVTDMSSETGVQGAFTGTFPGSSVALPTPPNIAVCVSIRTTLRSRNGRGRCYLPGIPEEQVDAVGNISGAYRTACVDAFEDLDALLLAGGLGPPLLMGVCSFYDGVDGDGKPIPRAAGLFSRATAYIVDPTIDTQRRRLRN